MGRYSKREVALIAELVADKLIATYRDEQVPLMVENFASAGFTRAELLGDEDKLFQMLSIAAYDRRPFSGAAGGYEVIWGIDRRSGSIPEALERLGLFTYEVVLSYDMEDLAEGLEREPYHGQSLATDGKHVRYARTLVELAQLVDRGLHAELVEAKNAEDVASIYYSLTAVHGIGDTIGAKLVKYLLREIGVGSVAPACFPLSVVWPITQEYHAAEAVGKLTARLDPTLTPLVMGLLLQSGEPFAIDALFYLQRHSERAFDQLIDDLRSIRGPQPVVEAPAPPAEALKADVKLAGRLLGVIEEILDAARSVTDADIRRAGLHGILTAKQIQGSARWLYNEMGKLAEQGLAGEMLAFYGNCLGSEKGQHIGWALDQLGRKSMESEAERFSATYEEGVGEGGGADADVSGANREH